MLKVEATPGSHPRHKGELLQLQLHVVHVVLQVALIMMEMMFH